MHAGLRSRQQASHTTGGGSLLPKGSVNEPCGARGLLLPSAALLPPSVALLAPSAPLLAGVTESTELVNSALAAGTESTELVNSALACCALADSALDCWWLAG